jgi:hypothetical protein
LGATPSEALLVLAIAVTILRPAPALNPAARILARRNLILVSYFAFLVCLNLLDSDARQFTDVLHVAGGHFAYYLCFWIAVVTIQSRAQLLRAVGFIRLGAAIVALLSILSNLAQRPIIPNLQTDAQNAPFIRVYSECYCLCVFVVILGLASHLRPGSALRIGPFEAMLSAVGFLLFLGRGATFVFVLMVWTCCMALGINRRLFVLLSAVALAVAAAAMLAAPALMAPVKTVFLNRASSAVSEVRNLEGSFGGRVEMMRRGFASFRDSPLFGLKMRRERVGVGDSEDKQITFNADVGHASLLFTTGACGFALVTWFVVQALRCLWRVHRFGFTITGRNLALAAFILIGFDYFVTQVASNLFACRLVAPYLLILAVGINADLIWAGGRGGVTAGNHHP